MRQRLNGDVPSNASAKQAKLLVSLHSQLSVTQIAALRVHGHLKNHVALNFDCPSGAKRDQPCTEKVFNPSDSESLHQTPKGSTPSLAQGWHIVVVGNVAQS